MDEYDIQEAFAAIEEELIKSMMRNMKRHRVEEVSEGIEWSMWQAEQLKALENYKKTNKKVFQKQFSYINNSMDNLINQARKQGNMDQEIEILETIKNGFKPSRALTKSTQTAAEFFRLNDRKLNALIKATKQDFQKAEHAVLRMANDQYRKIIFSAQVYANTGTATYEQAVDMATKDFLSAGLNCIEYKNGARVNIASYASMALKTASKRAYFTGGGEKRQEWGITTVIMNKRGAACPRCLPFVGKILIDDVWSGGKASDGSYPLMSSAIAKGLYHPNCKDSHTTYFEGITTPPKAMTEGDVKKAANIYSLEQQQKYNERTARKYKLLSDGSLDADNKAQYQAKYEEWKTKNDAFIKQHEDVLRKNSNAYNTRGLSLESKNVKTVKRFNNGSETNEYFYKNKEYTHWMNNLTNDVKDDIIIYTGDGYRDINRYLRDPNEYIYHDMSYIDEKISNIDSGISTFELSDNICVYRNLDVRAIDSVVDYSNVQGLIGQTYHDTGYMSSSTLPGIFGTRKDCKIEITVPKGTGRGAYVNEISEYKDKEYEFLIARNSKFNITDAYKKEGITHLKMEMIVDD